MMRHGISRTRACWAALPIVALSMVVLAGCGNKLEGGLGPVSGEAQGVLPYGSLQDWVSYADAAVVVRVAGAKEIPPSKDITSTGEGLVLRDLTVEVEEVLWARPGAKPAPEEFTYSATGWALHEEKRREMDVGEPAEVGKRYLIPIAHFVETPTYGKSGWMGLSSNTTYPIVDGRVRLDEHNSEGLSDATAIGGKTTKQIAALLARTVPDPRAAEKAALDPVSRYQEVAGGRNLDPRQGPVPPPPTATEPTPAESEPPATTDPPSSAPAPTTSAPGSTTTTRAGAPMQTTSPASPR